MKFEFSVFLKGFAMGTADLVPGVSGGTIALITGIYDRLITAIASIDQHAVSMLFKGEILGAWRRVDAGFLVTLASGMFAAIVLLASSIDWMLTTFPLPLWSFFFGLVLASTVMLLRPLFKEMKAPQFVAAAMGALLAASIALGQSLAVETSLLGFFLAGMIAICAMVLPGISGSFLLLLMGMYEPVINAVVGLDIEVLAIFVAGCVVGLLAFARVLEVLLARYRTTTMSTLVGILAGSLLALWPWQQVIATVVDRHGDLRPTQSMPVSPQAYAELGLEPMFLLSCLGFSIGVIIIAAVSFLGSRSAKAES